MTDMYRWRDGSMLEGPLDDNEKKCVEDGILFPVVVIPLDQWKRMVELAESWNSGDCCAAIADDMAGIIAKIREEAERG